ncbi:MAG: hypothetical protein ACR2PL_13305 [Dehalococcoidia bacterium]
MEAVHFRGRGFHATSADLDGTRGLVHRDDFMSGLLQVQSMPVGEEDRFWETHSLASNFDTRRGPRPGLLVEKHQKRLLAKIERER